jgi:hypothetical protein
MRRIVLPQRAPRTQRKKLVHCYAIEVTLITRNGRKDCFAALAMTSGGSVIARSETTKQSPSPQLCDRIYAREH